MDETNYILSIDPGMSTGITLISYTETTTPKLEEAWQFYGGLSALKKWREQYWSDYRWDSEWDYTSPAGLYFGPSHGLLSAQDILDWAYDEEDPEDTGHEVVTEKAVLTVVAEKFNARTTKGFSYTTASLEPLRCEGLLIDRGIMPDYSLAEKRWLDPKYQYLVGGEDLADKKKRQHAFLKDIDFYRTNKDFPDSRTQDGADDFRSSAAHGIAYLARTGHKPSFNLMTDWSAENG